MTVQEESEKAGLKLNIQKTKIMASGPITSWQIDGDIMETVTDFIFWGSKTTEDGDCSHEIKRRLLLGRKAMTNLESILKSRHSFANKGLSSQSYGFSSSHVWIWELEDKETWVLKNWCFWTVVLEKTLVNPLDCKEIQPVHPKGNQSWIFIGRTDAPIIWPPDVKNWVTWKDPDAGKDWRWEEKGTTEDEMAGRHHQLGGLEFEWALGVGDGQGGLACFRPWFQKELDMTEWLNLTELWERASWCLSGKESACHCRRRRFDLCVRKILWRKEWLPTPVFLPREFYGQRSLMGYHLWGCKELNMTWQLNSNKRLWGTVKWQSPY